MGRSLCVGMPCTIVGIALRLWVVKVLPVTSVALGHSSVAGVDISIRMQMSSGCLLRTLLYSATVVTASI